jgi:hypothetical protein
MLRATGPASAIVYKNESNIQNANKACFDFTRGACTVSFTMLVGPARCEV